MVGGDNLEMKLFSRAGLAGLAIVVLFGANARADELKTIEPNTEKPKAAYIVSAPDERFHAVLDEATDYFMSKVGCSDLDISAEYITKGKALLENNQYMDAVGWFKNSIDKCADNPESYVGAASAYSKLAEQQNATHDPMAEESFKEAVKWGERALYMLGLKNNSYVGGMGDEALAQLKKDCLFSLASAYQSLGMGDKAHECMSLICDIQNNK